VLEATHAQNRQANDDPFADSQAFHDEVYARIEQVQSRGVFYSPSVQAWIAATHATCLTTFSNKALSNESAVLPEAEAQMPPGIRTFATTFMAATEGSKHDMPRAIAQKLLGPAFFKSLRPRIAAIVDEQLDRFAAQGEMDLVPDFAFLLPVQVITDALGVSKDRYEDFAAWSLAVLEIADVRYCTPQRMREAEARVQEMIEFFRQEIERRRQDPGNDVISKLVPYSELTFEQQWVMLASLLIAGHETTVGGVGNGVRRLLMERAQFERIKTDPTLAVTAADEILRYDSPVCIPTARIALDDVQVGPVQVRRGERILPWIQAANMDPTVFKDARSFDVGRRPNPHLAFGNDRHHCLGSMLARAEIEIAVSKIAARFPNLEADTDHPSWSSLFSTRQLKSLKVRANY
jgi:cytochrome P450